VRFPTEIRFDATPLEVGEFAVSQQRGAHPRDGYVLFVHPYFEQRVRDLPYLVAYHLVTVNYGEIATRAEAECFGAALLGLDQDDYYEHICRLADELQAATAGPPGGAW
jgi:hypothetical protein